jgi:hypothetical protein
MDHKNLVGSYNISDNKKNIDAIYITTKEIKINNKPIGTLTYKNSEYDLYLTKKEDVDYNTVGEILLNNENFFKDNNKIYNSIINKDIRKSLCDNYDEEVKKY